MTEPVSEERQKAYLVETLVADKLIDYDNDTRTATLTDAGRRFIA